ncbi:MAG: hypothetical protein RR623_07750 [Bacilli bacterium]
MQGILYTYTRGVYKVRKIEEGTKTVFIYLVIRDIHPSSKTNSELIKYLIGKNVESIFKKLNNVIEAKYNINANPIYVFDRSKINADMTKTLFVW